MMKLNRLFLSQNISVDNALSMNQILHQIVNQMKEIVDFINNLELRANEYTDQEILKLKNDLESQLATLEQTLKTYTNDSIDTYNVEVINPQLQTIRDTIDTLNRTLNDRITDEVGILNRRINSEVSTLNRIIEDTKIYLEDLIKKGMAYVYSCVSGLHLPLQNVLGEIGNVLKQTLSYNWNSIDEFKTVQLNMSDVPQDYTEMNDNLTFFKTLEGGYFTPQSNVYTNDNIDYLLIIFTGPPLDYIGEVTINDNDITDDIILSDTPQMHSIWIPLSLLNVISDIKIYSSSIYSDVTLIFELSVYCFRSYPSGIDTLITFNSIKLAMQELNVNYNSLSYTGVNTFYELNETGKMFDTDGVKSDYFTGNKYKVIHNNFDSDFFKEVENNENEGE